MRDHPTPAGLHFAGCHYLNTDAFWFPEVADLPGTDLLHFDHHYGCWTDLEGEIRTSTAFAQPLLSGPSPQIPDRAESWTTLAERMEDHPAAARDLLHRWLTRFVDPAQLHSSAAEPLQVGRISYPDDLEGVRRVRAVSARADRILGVPRSDRLPPLGPEPAAIPRNGFTLWFEAWARHLDHQGVDVRTGAPIRLRRSARCAELVLQGMALCESPDAVIWCANPTPLSRLLLDTPLRTPPLRIRVAHVLVDALPSPEPWYWQVFSMVSPILRGYWYAWEGARVSLECLTDDTPLTRILEDLQRMMRTWGVSLSVQAVHEQQTVRYALLESGDPQRLKALREAARLHRILVAGHDAYGRNARLRALVDAMAREGL